MNPYEGMFVVYNKEAQKEHDYLEQLVTGLLEKVGAQLVRLTKWDERQLAYEINGQRDGIFYLAHFEAPGDAIAALKREAELNEIVLRLLVLRLDRIPTEEEVDRKSGRAPKVESPPPAEAAEKKVEKQAESAGTSDAGKSEDSSAATADA